MKLLRVLTGIHAGVQMQLAPGNYRIGADSDADIRISDWSGAGVSLNVSDEGTVVLHTMSGDSEANVSDFLPLRFRDTVLCVGPIGTEWPSDVELLSRVLPARPAVRLPAKGWLYRVLIVGACAALSLALAAIATPSLSSQDPVVTRNVRAEEVVERVSAALAVAHMNELHAHVLDGRVVVSGLVGNASEDRTVHEILQHIAPDEMVSLRYGVASEIAQTIDEAIGVPSAQVLYAGDARFLVTGPPHADATLRAAVARIQADVGPNVKGIDVRSNADHAPPPLTAYSELVATSDVRYAQTPDGIKHLFMLGVTNALTGGNATSAYR
jgi:type III secretion protein D